MIKKSFVLFALAVSFLLISCSLTGTITLNSADLDGSAELKMVHTDYFSDLLYDLSAWTGESEDPVGDAVKSAAEGLEKSDSVSNVVASSKENLSEISLSFESLQKFADSLAESGNQSLFSVFERNGHTVLKVLINQDTFDCFSDILPFSDDSSFAIYSPKYNDNMEEDEYLEMLEFVFSEEISDEINCSSVSLIIQLPSDVVFTTAQKLDSKTVRYDIPLLNLMLLKKPLGFEVEF